MPNFNSRGAVGRRTKLNTSKAKAAHAWQHQAAVCKLRNDADTEHLQNLVNQHLTRTKHALTTAELIEVIITRYPDCPQAQSFWVDQLLAGDEALAHALREVR